MSNRTSQAQAQACFAILATRNRLCPAALAQRRFACQWAEPPRRGRVNHALGQTSLWDWQTSHTGEGTCEHDGHHFCCNDQHPAYSWVSIETERREKKSKRGSKADARCDQVCFYLFLADVSASITKAVRCEDGILVALNLICFRGLPSILT